MSNESRPTAFVIGPFGDGTRAARRAGGGLPYGAQHLEDQGYEVEYCDPAASWALRVARLRRPIRAVHKLTPTPLLGPVIEPVRALRADLLVCLFEDNLAALAILARVRRMFPRANRRSVVVVCWLAEEAASLSPRARRRWRRRLTAFDRAVVYSSNQVDVLTRNLDLPAGFVVAVPFGVSVQEPTLVAAEVASSGGEVLAVGTDVGRDFGTYVAATRTLARTVTIVTNKEIAASLGDVSPIRVIGPVDRPTYLQLLGSAAVVVSPTHARAYPTGQTVVLEAFALGKPCVITRSAAMDDYVTDGTDAVTVPVGDAPALREAIESLLADEERRERLGSAARRTSARFTEARMWASIADAAHR